MKGTITTTDASGFRPGDTVRIYDNQGDSVFRRVVSVSATDLVVVEVRWWHRAWDWTCRWTRLVWLWVRR